MLQLDLGLHKHSDAEHSISAEAYDTSTIDEARLLDHLVRKIRVKLRFLKAAQNAIRHAEAISKQLEEDPKGLTAQCGSLRTCRAGAEVSLS